MYSDPWILTIALDNFSALLFAPPKPEVLTEIKRTIQRRFLPLIFRLELSHNAN